jgi:hypothetical protein
VPSRRADPGGRRPPGARLAALVAAVVLAGVVGLPMAGVAAASSAGAPAPVPVAARQDGEPLPTPQFTADEVRRRADDILAGPAYQEPEPSLVERALKWIGEQLRRLVPDLPVGSPTPSPAAGSMGALNWIALMLLLGLVAFLLYVVISRGWGRRRRRPDADPLVLTETEARRLPDEWIAAADRFEAGGRWREALRCRFRALVGELIERGVARDLPGRTSGELRRDVRRRAPDAAVAFEEATRLFDDAWYGDRPTGAEENARFRALAASVLDATKRHRPVDAADPGPALVVGDGAAPRGPA